MWLIFVFFAVGQFLRSVWTNALFVISDDTIICACVYLNWAFSKRLYWKVCACGNWICEIMCIWYIKREIELEANGQGTGDDFTIPLTSRIHRPSDAMGRDL